VTDLLFAPVLRAARDALFGRPDPWRRRTPPSPLAEPFRQGPTMPFRGWPNLTYKDPLP
jgi:hypothetical protein